MVTLMSTVEATRLAPEDLLTMPGGERCELVDGELREKPMGAESDWIGAKIIRLLGGFVEQLGIGDVFGAETGYQCFPDDRRKVRKPDVSFVAAGRLPGGAIPKGHIPVPPDLAVEVISPNDTYEAVESKLADYASAEISLVWVVSPETRTVKVYADGDESPTILREQDTLTGGNVLPEFTCPVASLFPPKTAGAGE